MSLGRTADEVIKLAKECLEGLEVEYIRRHPYDDYLFNCKYKNEDYKFYMDYELNTDDFANKLAQHMLQAIRQLEQGSSIVQPKTKPTYNKGDYAGLSEFGVF